MFDIRSVDIVESDEIPASAELATRKRPELVEQLSEIDDEIADLFLNNSLPSTEQLAAAIRRATVSLKFSPVFFGFAVRTPPRSHCSRASVRTSRVPQRVR